MISNYHKLPSVRDSLLALRGALQALSMQHFVVVPIPKKLMKWTEMNLIKVMNRIDKLKKQGWKEVNNDGKLVLVKDEKDDRTLPS
jgi:hypothetical protein